jgi:hypothetical protein
VPKLKTTNRGPILGRNRDLFISTASRPLLESTQPDIRGGEKVLFLSGLKRPGCESGHAVLGQYRECIEYITSSQQTVTVRQWTWPSTGMWVLLQWWGLLDTASDTDLVALITTLWTLRVECQVLRNQRVKRAWVPLVLCNIFAVITARALQGRKCGLYNNTAWRRAEMSAHPWWRLTGGYSVFLCYKLRGIFYTYLSVM